MSVEQLDDGRVVACKRPVRPEDGPDLRAEAARLSALDHPGVVKLVALREAEEGPVLVTAYGGPRTVATAGIVAADRAARLVADLATTLADLHASGQVHGDVRPEHALVTGDRIVLCSPAPHPAGIQPADDVGGAGEVLRVLLDPDLEEEPIPDRRPWRRHRWLGYRHRALLTLVDQATADEPGRRPSARALATALRGVAGGETVSAGAAGPSDSPAPGRWTALVDLVAIRWCALRSRTGDRGRRLRPVLLGGLGAAVTALGIVALSGEGTSASGRSRGAAPPPRPAPACGEAGGPLSADLDGDGCPESIRSGPGWLEVDGDRFRLGLPADAVSVGDWDGDGRATVALLREGGALWTFPAWDPDRAVRAQPAGQHPGATGLRRRPTEHGHRLEVVHADGTTEAVSPT